ncbi:MAG: XRE family transcriptional regulator, partial [Pseudonocardiaceae bacterium]
EPGFAALLERLRATSPEVRDWWPRHDVAPLASGIKRVRHPELGELQLRYVVLQIADDPEQKFVTFTADDRDQARIAKLIQ